MTQSQLDLIKKMDWDYLIILDACRYDYFEKVYSEYFQGNVKKVLSPGNWTIKWLKSVWGNKKYSNIIYISGNPYINSKGLLRECDAKKHFYKIIDVWDFGWDKKSNTTHPEKINEVAQKIISRYTEKKVIIHYMQPHAPYISEEAMKLKEALGKKSIKRKIFIQLKKIFPSKIRRKLGITMELFLFQNKFEKVLYTVGLKIPDIELLDVLGIEGIKKAYEENLRFVLKYVKELVEFIPSGKIVITADHGELLGEDGKWFHPADCWHPKLLEVPWLEIDKGRKETEGESEGKKEEEEKEYSEKDEEIIKERLRALGYLE